jgi:hypothetical protein
MVLARESSSRGRRLTEAGVSVIVLEARGRRFARADRQQLVDQRQHFRVCGVVVLRDRTNRMAADKLGRRGWDQCSESRRDHAL